MAQGLFFLSRSIPPYSLSTPPAGSQVQAQALGRAAKDAGWFKQAVGGMGECKRPLGLRVHRHTGRHGGVVWLVLTTTKSRSVMPGIPTARREQRPEGEGEAGQEAATLKSMPRYGQALPQWAPQK